MAVFLFLRFFMLTSALRPSACRRPMLRPSPTGQPPVHRQDPDIAALGAKVQDSLLTTRLLTKLRLNGTLEIKPTRLGFEFTAPGQRRCPMPVGSIRR